MTTASPVNDIVPADLPEVAILLSVFDGERFIAEQLDSLAGQHGVRWSLTWRDDGSDPRRSGAGVLEKFRARFPGQVFHADDPAGALGVGDSYMALLARAPDTSYVAFADQDDVWLPGKLARAVSLLSRLPEQVPALYCGRQCLVNAVLDPIGRSAVPPRPLGFGNALVQNVATGCTMVLNRAARQAVLAMPPPSGTLHDWWCYVVLAGIGGRLVYDAEPFILYRQHEHNAVGATGAYLSRALRALRRGPGPFLDRLDLHLDRLRWYRDRLTPESRAVLDALCAARRAPLWRRLPALMRADVYRQGLAEDLVLRTWLMLRRGPR
jgi:hypothetical protein